MIFQTPPISFEEVAALRKIEELRRQLRFRVAQPRRWVGLVRRVLGARAIQGSNSIEGYDVSVEDALAAIGGEEPTEAPEEDWNAVSGYRRAMTYVLQLAQDEHFEYTPQILRSLHFMMCEYTLDASPGCGALDRYGFATTQLATSSTRAHPLRSCRTWWES